MVVPPGVRARSLDAGAGMVLGVPTRRARTSGQERLAAGSTLLLYTDGLVERRSSDLDEMTLRLEDLATELAPLRCPPCATSCWPGPGPTPATTSRCSRSGCRPWMLSLREVAPR